ncbi:MAG: hypothetical protein QM817_36260 [Archangium sp.]
MVALLPSIDDLTKLQLYVQVANVRARGAFCSPEARALELSPPEEDVPSPGAFAGFEVGQTFAPDHDWSCTEVMTDLSRCVRADGISVWISRKQGRVSLINIAHYSEVPDESACARWARIEALLVEHRGPPSSRDDRVCAVAMERQAGRGACSRWKKGDLQLVVGVVPSIDNLDELKFFFQIADVRTRGAFCSPEAPE